MEKCVNAVTAKSLKIKSEDVYSFCFFKTMAEINCAVDCIDGCVLGDQCPHKDEQQKTSEFIESTSLDDMLAIAAEAVRRKQQERVSEGPKWVFPEDGIAPDA